MIERKLTEVSEELRRLREELRISTEQLEHFSSEADEARIRSLVSETPLSEQSFSEAARHAEAMRRHQVDIEDRIERLEAKQDELLDRMFSE